MGCRACRSDIREGPNRGLGSRRNPPSMIVWTFQSDPTEKSTRSWTALPTAGTCGGGGDYGTGGGRSVPPEGPDRLAGQAVGDRADRICRLPVDLIGEGALLGGQPQRLVPFARRPL